MYNYLYIGTYYAFRATCDACTLYVCCMLDMCVNIFEISKA